MTKLLLLLLVLDRATAAPEVNAAERLPLPLRHASAFAAVGAWGDAWVAVSSFLGQADNLTSASIVDDAHRIAGVQLPCLFLRTYCTDTTTSYAHAIFIVELCTLHPRIGPHTAV